MTQQTDIECQCGRGSYNPAKYHSCYACYLDRRADFLVCVFCGRLHSPNYPTCFECRTGNRGEQAGNLKFEILVRDQFTCRVCGSNDSLRINHIVPCSDGGSAMPWNLRVLCQPCDRHARDVDEYDQDMRIMLMHLYFTFGWKMLEPSEREQLVTDSKEYGREFVWHARFGGKSIELPQWVIDYADTEMK